ncbi:MAG: type II toxin-antitoxin system death-on-curing family toxin [Verrucomicrobiota bacterium]
MSRPEPVWIKDESVFRMHSRQLAEHGGTNGLRDEEMLLSALSRPRQKWDYADPKPDLCELASAYAFGIPRNHPFLDGNKRTAVVVCETFLLLNGVRPSASEEEKYPVYLSLAAGELEEEEFTRWLQANTEQLS